MNFHDDPQPLITELDAAWKRYMRVFDAKMKELEASVVSWRWATDDMFPSHPLFGLADTTKQAEPWGPFERHWLRDDDSKANLKDGWRHGFDSQGRIVLARNHIWGYATFWNESFCDRLRIYEARGDSGRFVWGLPYQDIVQFHRYWYDEAGRIGRLCCYSREDETHYRHFEWFEYEGNRCVESIQQSFEIMPEIPPFQEDATEDELRADYRPLQGDELLNNLVESMFSRRHVQYSFSPRGELLKAEEFRGDGEPIDELLFEQLPQRSLEETSEMLAAKAVDLIEKAVKKRAAIKPYRALVLIYSAEHAHCGLPHQVSVLSHEAPWPEDRFYHEAYDEALDVPFKRPFWSLLSEFNQRCNARFAIDEFEAQTNAAVDVMRTIAEQLHLRLTGAKHVTEDFTVVVLDDHGDVDSFSVPA